MAIELLLRDSIETEHDCQNTRKRNPDLLFPLFAWNATETKRNAKLELEIGECRLLELLKVLELNYRIYLVMTFFIDDY